MSKYQSKYENLRTKMDQTMLTLNQARSVGGYNKDISVGYSPLRKSQSRSPHRGPTDDNQDIGQMVQMPNTEVMPQRRF
jgi:hypothetical protein